MNNRNTRRTANNQLAAVWKKIPFIENSEILDIGCGNYWINTLNYCIRKNAARYTPYDKYWNINELPLIGTYDIIVIANTLNVIEELNEINEVLETAKSYLDVSGDIYIQIYEGDKTGKGRETTKGYQRNEKTEQYLPIIKATFPESEYIIKKKGNIIKITLSPF